MLPSCLFFAKQALQSGDPGYKARTCFYGLRIGAIFDIIHINKGLVVNTHFLERGGSC